MSEAALRIGTVEGEAAVTLAAGELEATFLPGLGLLGTSLRHRGEELLALPHVGLALDPEWHVGPGQVPGRVIGSMDADALTGQCPQCQVDLVRVDGGDRHPAVPRSAPDPAERRGAGCRGRAHGGGRW